jgi:superfamily I DNA and/or RNA helicase
MFHNDYHYVLLDTQYRMKPAISLWPNAKFYDSEVNDGDNVKQSDYGSESMFFLEGQPYTWVQVVGKEEKNSEGSTHNKPEAEVVVSLVLDLKTKRKVPAVWLESPDNIRIITFYKAQESLLKTMLADYGLRVTVSTVDSAQGCEADIVILSVVRGTMGQMGFVQDMQRLNVALTRAKYQLVCVGDVRSIAEIESRNGHLELIDMAQDAAARSHLAKAPLPLPAPTAQILHTRPFEDPKRIAKTKSKQKKRQKPKREVDRRRRLTSEALKYT